MYPVGVVFGMGFNTATEVLLLTTTAFLASEHIPWQAIYPAQILLAFLMTGLGMGLSFVPLQIAAQAGVPPNAPAWPPA
jgi:high-affinity nickel permease